MHTEGYFGGLGVMDLAVFNQALLIKWYWQWTRPQNTLWKPIMQINIGRDGLPLSPIFTSALKKSIQFCLVSFTHVIGSGVQIQLWNHKWAGTPPPFLRVYQICTHMQLIKMSVFKKSGQQPHSLIFSD